MEKKRLPKLTLKKESVSNLDDQSMNHLKGGGFLSLWGESCKTDCYTVRSPSECTVCHECWPDTEPEDPYPPLDTFEGQSNCTKTTVFEIDCCA